MSYYNVKSDTRNTIKKMKKVAVIGAGPSGITAIKNFIDEGFDVTAFERCDGVGGNWRFNDPSGHSSMNLVRPLLSSECLPSLLSCLSADN